MAPAVPAARRDTRALSQAVPPVGSADGRFFAVEILISLLFNMLIAAAATWLLSDWSAATSGRFADTYADIGRATIGPMIGFVIPVTLINRRRVRRGGVAPMPGGAILPYNVVLRATILCIVALVVLATPAAWLLATIAPRGAAFLLFKILYGAAIAVTATPIVLVAALRDPAPALQGAPA